MTILTLLSASNVVKSISVLPVLRHDTSEHDVTVAAIVCATVFLCVLTVSISLTMIILGKRRKRKAEEDARNRKTAAKEEEENAEQKQKVLYDAAWRTIEHYWKSVPCDYEGKFMANNDRLKEAWEYVRFYWKENMQGDGKSEPDNRVKPL